MNSFVITALDGTTFDLFDPRIPCTIEEGSQHCGLQGVDTLAVKVRSALPLPLAVGDSCSLFGKRYFLNTVPPVTKAAPRKFVYELVFEGIQYSLMDVRFLLPEGSVGDSLTADLGMFLSVLTDNITRVKGNWTLGVFPSGTEYKTLVFDGENCLSVLQQICEAYGQEFEIEQDEGMNILHIRKAGQSLPFTFKFGSAGGLYSLTRQNVDSKNIVTRLYVYGGSNNLAKYRHGKLCLPGKSKNQSYIEESNAINAYGVRENIQVFGDIFPNRYGEVTAPGDDYLSFVDSTMNFDLNEKEADGITTRWLIADVTAKVHFNTGRLAGYEFEIQRDGGYDHATKTVKLIPFTDENGMEFPSRTNAAFQLSAGDKYFFKDIRLPDQYVTDAENELAEKGQAFYAQNSYPQVTYGLNIHEHFIKQFAGSGNITTLFSVGDYIHVVDPDVAVDRHIRIASFERDVLKPYKYVLTLADVVTRDVFTRAISDVLALDRIIAMNNLADPSRARRAWRASQEVLAMVFDPEGDYYSDRIKPLSIETGMLQVGAKSMQFVLRNIIFEPNYEGNPNVMHVTAGQLIHYAIEESIKTWNLAEVTFSEMVSSTAYYIYARCPKGTDAGSVLLDTVQRKVDYEAGYYTFLIGVLNSVETDDDGGRPARFVSLTYGSSTVNGRFIRTGRIESSGGGTGYIDLDAPDGIEISGKTVFRSGSSGYDNIVDKPDLTPYDEALNYVDNVLPDTLEHIQNQLDNAIESWFYHYDPTVSNYPASDWTTGALREAHLDDTFTNLDSGQSWRFTKDAGGVYSWTLMADTAASRALVLAGQAKDTADGKRRSFVSQPYPPYDAGDLWVQGPSGDIMRCQTSRQTGSYVASDWVKASKYTDDTAALAAIESAASDLKGYVDGAFADGLISEAEAVSIGLYLNTLATEKAGIDAGYTALYSNALLTGTAKSGLNSAKSTLDMRYTNLVGGISAAIADGKATAAEKANVDSLYALYRSALSAYSTRNEEAHAFITSSVDGKSSDYATAAKEDMAKRLGYSSYNDLVAAAVAGKTVVDGGTVRTSLIDAAAVVTEGLVTKWITAAYISALNIVTSKLTVTDGAKIGNFNISGGWLTCNASPGSDVGYIDMRGTGTRTAFGKNLASSTYPAVLGDGVTCTAVISNRNNAGPGGETVALNVEASGDYSNEVYDTAILAQGRVRIKGGMSVVEESVLNEPISVKNLRHYRCFAFQPTSGTYAYLPSTDEIQAGFGYFSNGQGVSFKSFIRIHILITRWATSYIRLQAPSSTPLIDQNGNVLQYRDMEKGDYCELTYHNGAWYLTALNS